LKDAIDSKRPFAIDQLNGSSADKLAIRRKCKIAGDFNQAPSKGAGSRHSLQVLGPKARHRKADIQTVNLALNPLSFKEGDL